MIRYQVRSRNLIDLVNEIKLKALVLAPYFQRKLVWRLAHKINFIETILLGYPFPEIFLARGEIDIDDMRSTAYLVDGQQRMNSILEFINDKFNVNGLKFSDLSLEQREKFLKYEIAVIDLDIKSSDDRVKDIFMRLNRTFYSLTSIERDSTEFASSEFMQVAKLLCGELFSNVESDVEIDETVGTDPNITVDFLRWSKKVEVKNFRKFLLEQNIFTKYDISRQVHLTYALNILSTVKLNNYYNRNSIMHDYLEEFSDVFSDKENLIKIIEKASKIFNDIKLKPKSYFLNKANAFTLIIEIVKSISLNFDIKKLKINLEEFEKNIPVEYSIYAREAVNDKQARITRGEFIKKILENSISV